MDMRVSGGMNGKDEKSEGKETACQTVIIKERRIVYERKDVIMAFAMILCGYFYWSMIHIVTLGAGVTVFAAILCSVLYVYMKAYGMKQNKRSMVCLGIMILSGVNFFIFDEYTTKFFNFLFLTLCFIYWVCLTARKNLENRLSLYIIGDFINETLILPFTNFLQCFAALHNGITKNKYGKNIISVFIGLVLCIPVFALVISLLISADAAFEAVISRLNSLLSDNLQSYFIRFILGIPVACYLFGLVVGNIKDNSPKTVNMDDMDRMGQSFCVVPRVTTYAILTVLNVIYLAFFASQGTYLFSAFADILPNALTYAEYARRGFFELCSISAINLFILSIMHLLTKRENSSLKGLKIHTSLVSIFTMLLISTAMSKMVLYIHYYGLTKLRVFTSWFMILMFVLFAIILLRQWKRFHASRAMVISFVVCFMILCYGNVDGMIAKYNIYRYEAGTLKMMDKNLVSSLSDGAIPYLYDVYKTTEHKKTKEMLYSKITGDYGEYMEEEPFQSTYRDFNLQSAKADKIKKELKAQGLKNSSATVEKASEL